MSLLAPEPPPNVLASDADRERTITILRDESVSGRLSPDELAKRLEKAFAAKTLGDLRALIADLPEGNVNPLGELVSGAINRSMNAFRIGMWITAAVVILAVFLPIIGSLASHGQGIPALVLTAVMLAVLVVGSARVRRRHTRPRQ